MSYFDELIMKESKRITKKINTLEAKKEIYGDKYQGEIEALEREREVLNAKISESDINKIKSKIKNLRQGLKIGENVYNELMSFLNYEI